MTSSSKLKKLHCVVMRSPMSVPITLRQEVISLGKRINYVFVFGSRSMTGILVLCISHGSGQSKNYT